MVSRARCSHTEIFICTPRSAMVGRLINRWFTYKRWFFSILDVRSFRRANSNTDHYLVVEKFSDVEDINRAWKNITEDIKTLAKGSRNLHGLKQH
jgi:hypothetical protein